MSRHAFDPLCPDCRPALLDTETGETLPNDHPIMLAVNAVWDASSREDQEAFHRVTVHNGRNASDLERLAGLQQRIEAALKAKDEN